MDIIAHRGASYLEPENTLSSIKKAIQMDVDYVEFDVRKTKDHYLVVIHDARVDRTTNGQGKVSKMLLKDIQKLDAGKKQIIPTLEQVLELVGHKKRIVLEIKEPGYEDLIINTIQSYNLKSPLLASFYHGSVEKVKKLNPDLKTGVIVSSQPVNISNIALDVNADVNFIKKNFFDVNVVENVKVHDLNIYPWVVDEPEQAKKFLDLGADGFVTNKLLDKKMF